MNFKLARRFPGRGCFTSTEEPPHEQQPQSRAGMDHWRQAFLSRTTRTPSLPARTARSCDPKPAGARLRPWLPGLLPPVIALRGAGWFVPVHERVHGQAAALRVCFQKNNCLGTVRSGEQSGIQDHAAACDACVRRKEERNGPYGPRSPVNGECQAPNCRFPAHRHHPAPAFCAAEMCPRVAARTDGVAPGIFIEAR